MSQIISSRDPSTESTSMFHYPETAEIADLRAELDEYRHVESQLLAQPEDHRGVEVELHSQLEESRYN